MPNTLVVCTTADVDLEKLFVGNGFAYAKPAINSTREKVVIAFIRLGLYATYITQTLGGIAFLRSIDWSVAKRKR